jgi:hypothetical protein
MNVWLADLNRLVDVLTRHPSTPMEKGFIVGLACVVTPWVFGRVAAGARIPNADPFRCFVAVAFGTAAMLASTIAVERYVPGVGGRALKPWLPAIAATLAGLVVAVPFTALWMRAKYFEAIVPWLASLVACVVVVFLVGAAFDACATGKKGSKRVPKRKPDLEQILR